MAWLDVLKSVLYGVVEGVTEWLPISSTGHLLLLERLVPFRAGGDAISNAQFFSFFLVVVQLGAVLAVVVTFWSKLWPVRMKDSSLVIDQGIIRLWAMILVACVPAAVIGVLFDDKIEQLFYKRPSIRSVEQIDWRAAILIGLFQLIAAILPGTSRSGATILGGLMIGMTRSVAATFTFYLAVPVMAGASLLKLLKLGTSFNLIQWLSVFVGMGAAYLVSILVIRFLLAYIRKHDFRIFAFYRIALGMVVIAAALSGLFSTVR